MQYLSALGKSVFLTTKATRVPSQQAAVLKELFPFSKRVYFKRSFQGRKIWNGVTLHLIKNILISPSPVAFSTMVTMVNVQGGKERNNPFSTVQPSYP